MMKITLSNSVPMNVVVDSASGDKRFEPDVDKIYDNLNTAANVEELLQGESKNKDAIYIVGENDSKVVYSYDEASDTFVPLTSVPISTSQLDTLLGEFFPPQEESTT